MESDEIETRFTYHAPRPGQTEKYEALRAKAKELAYLIEEMCPVSREKSSAFSYLDMTIMWANAAIARRTL
jgi:hypothetical protein